MTMRHSRFRALGLFPVLALLAFLWIPAASSVINYSLHPLMTVYSAATGINDQNSVLARDSEHSYVIHSDGAIDTLSIRGEKLTNDGTVFGQVGSTSGVIAKEKDGTIEIIDDLSHSVWGSVYGANDENDLAIVLRPNFFSDHGGVYDGSVQMFPIDPERFLSINWDINNSDVSVGMMWGYQPSLPVYWENGVAHPIAIDGMVQGQAENINNQGQIVGQFISAADSQAHGFLYSEGSVQDLGLVGTFTGWRNLDINDAGQILMNITDPGASNWRPTVLSGGEVFRLPTFEEGAFALGMGISKDGWVAGYAYDPSTLTQRAVVWIPESDMPETVPEPGSLALLLGGLAAVGMVSRKGTSPRLGRSNE